MGVSALSHRFEDRVVVISGGGSGIGRATAVAMAAEGASLALGGLERDPIEDTLGDLRRQGSRALGHVVDIGRAGDADRLIHAAIDAFGRVDVVVNCAGTSSVGDLVDMDVEEWNRVFDTNVKGVFLLSRAAIPFLMQSDGGAIVNLGSQLGFSAVGGFAAYCASKAAVVHLTRAMALELIPHGIRVNSVCPGGTETPLLMRAFPGGKGPQGSLQDLALAHPIGRLARPEEIAAAILFLASEEASFVVGAALVADGGYILP
jgi:NAD(P)-dependent dehydrogenase (short-subunit alcohol dehydrogenase family)